jgi:hypothetical protein
MDMKVSVILEKIVSWNVIKLLSVKYYLIRTYITHFNLIGFVVIPRFHSSLIASYLKVWSTQFEIK